MKNKVLFGLLVFAVGAAFLLGACAPKPAPPTPPPAPPPVEEPIKPIPLKLSTWVPPPSLGAKLIDEWIKEVEDRTNGRVKITAYHGGALGAAADHHTMVLTGIADIVLSSGYEGVLLRHMAAFLPFLYSSSKQGGWVHHQMMEKYALTTELKDVKLLWFIPVAPARLLFTTPKHVRTLEDLKGMKIAVSAETEIPIVKALGAAPVFLPVPEVYTSLERGLVDGGFDNWEKCWIFKHYEVTKYRTALPAGVWVPEMPVLMNLDAWKRLPPDIQKVFDETTGLQRTVHCGAVFDEVDAMFRGKITEEDKKVGKPEVYDLPAEELARWKKATAPIIEGWVKDMEAKGIPGREILDHIYYLLERYPK